MSVGDISQVNQDIERGRVSYEDAIKVADAFVAAGHLPQGKRDQIRKPQESLSQDKKPSAEAPKGTSLSPIGDKTSQPSADQVNVDSGAESKVKSEDADLEAMIDAEFDAQLDTEEKACKEVNRK